LLYFVVAYRIDKEVVGFRAPLHPKIDTEFFLVQRNDQKL
jgi:hypothetical protein